MIVDVTTGARRTQVEIGCTPDLCFDVNPRDSRTIMADWRHLPLQDETVELAIYDPPHQVYGFGEKSWLVGRYASFRNLANARDLLIAGFAEIRRILKPNGSCLLKWSTNHRPLTWILGLAGMESQIWLARPSMSSQPDKPFSHAATVFWVELFKRGTE